jgi:hypothetical protein
LAGPTAIRPQIATPTAILSGQSDHRVLAPAPLPVKMMDKIDYLSTYRETP